MEIDSGYGNDSDGTVVHESSILSSLQNTKSVDDIDDGGIGNDGTSIPSAPIQNAKSADEIDGEIGSDNDKIEDNSHDFVHSTSVVSESSDTLIEDKKSASDSESIKNDISLESSLVETHDNRTEHDNSETILFLPGNLRLLVRLMILALQITTLNIKLLYLLSMIRNLLMMKLQELQVTKISKTMTNGTKNSHLVRKAFHFAYQQTRNQMYTNRNLLLLKQ